MFLAAVSIRFLGGAESSPTKLVIVLYLRRRASEAEKKTPSKTPLFSKPQTKGLAGGGHSGTDRGGTRLRFLRWNHSTLKRTTPLLITKDQELILMLLFRLKSGLGERIVLL